MREVSRRKEWSLKFSPGHSSRSGSLVAVFDCVWPIVPPSCRASKGYNMDGTVSMKCRAVVERVQKGETEEGIAESIGLDKLYDCCAGEVDV